MASWQYVYQDYNFWQLKLQQLYFDNEQSHNYSLFPNKKNSSILLYAHIFCIFIMFPFEDSLLKEKKEQNASCRTSKYFKLHCEQLTFFSMLLYCTYLNIN
jgi:hypothetical protein